MKTIILLLLGIVLGVALTAGYLYWQVQSDVYEAYEKGEVTNTSLLMKYYPEL